MSTFPPFDPNRSRIHTPDPAPRHRRRPARAILLSVIGFAIVVLLVIFVALVSNLLERANNPRPVPAAASVAPDYDPNIADASMLELAFRATMSQHDPAYKDPAVAQATVEMAESFCAVLDSGEEYGDAFIRSVMIAEDGGLDGYDAGFIYGAAVPAFCPQHSAAQAAFNESVGS